MRGIIARMAFGLFFILLNASETGRGKSSWNKEIEKVLSGKCDYQYLGFSTHPWLYHLPDYSEKPEKKKEQENSVIGKKENDVNKDVKLLEKPINIFATKQPKCKLCDGKILTTQLSLVTQGDSYHALCATGHKGLDCKKFLEKVKRSQRVYRRQYDRKMFPYCRFFATVVSIFEKTERFICLADPMIVNELQRKGFNTAHISTEKNMWKKIKDLPHIICWTEYHSEGSHCWAIHRKHYGKASDVDWKTYVIEILKSRQQTLTIPELTDTRVIPKNLLAFILWKTGYSSFAAALAEIQDIQLCFETLSVRLKK